MSRDRWVEIIAEIAADDSVVYEALALDIHDQGRYLVEKKYRHLRLAYVFLALGVRPRRRGAGHRRDRLNRRTDLTGATPGQGAVGALGIGGTRAAGTVVALCRVDWVAQRCRRERPPRPASCTAGSSTRSSAGCGADGAA